MSEIKNGAEIPTFEVDEVFGSGSDGIRYGDSARRRRQVNEIKDGTGEQWWEGEREADADIAAGRVARVGSVAEMDALLDRVSSETRVKLSTDGPAAGEADAPLCLHGVIAFVDGTPDVQSIEFHDDVPHSRLLADMYQERYGGDEFNQTFKVFEMRVIDDVCWSAR